MAKKTKRERKFQATGGIKARLERGKVAKKGKLNGKKRKSKHGDDAETHAPKPARPTLENKADDFLGQENLGDLDIEQFFEKAAEEIKDLDENNSDSEGDSDLEESSENDDDGSGSEQDSDSDIEEEAPPTKLQRIPSERESAGSDDSDQALDESDDDDEEDLDAAEEQMKAAMAKMKQMDPDFHDYLKENEESLLEFGNDDEDEHEEEASDDESTTKAAAVHLTAELLKSLAKSTFKSYSIKALKKLIGAYRSACHLADSSEKEKGKTRSGESGISYLIDSSKVFDELMVLCLNRMHRAFDYHLLGLNDSDTEPTSADDTTEQDEAGKDVRDVENKDAKEKPLSPKILENSDRWSQIRPLLSSFFRSSIHLISSAKEPELLTFILKSLSKYLKFLTPFPNLAAGMLKTMVGLWSAPLDSAEDYQVVRLNAFFRVRQFALTQPFPFIEDILKKTYLSYAKRAKFGTASSVASTLPTLTFMGNCLVELYSLDYHSSYQHAFVYIRQLALLLRSAIQKKTKEALQQVYCWQFLHCLKLWVAVLACAAPEDDAAIMRSLIYPLTEIIFGVVRLAPASARYLPFRFHCIRLLQQLAASSELFIPTTSILFDCINLKEWTMKPKKDKTGSARGVQMQYVFKLGKDDPLRTFEQLEEGMNELILLMQRELELYRYSAGFPEFSVRIVQECRKLLKETRNPRWKTYIRSCIDTCERYSKAAVQGRTKLQEAPKDVARLECLKPISEKCMRERYEALVQREQKDIAHRVASMAKHDKEESEQKASEDTKQSRKKKKHKKEKGTREQSKQVKIDPSALEEEDQVTEGFEWSDEE